MDSFAPVAPRATKIPGRILGIDSVIAQTQFLPPAFELLPRLLKLLEDPDHSCEDVADIIRVDQSLTADVLHIANNAYIGSRDRTDCLSSAINRIGLREIHHTVMKIVSSPALKCDETLGVKQIDLWRHSLAAAVATQALARELADIEPEAAFTAGLLHDIGKVILAHAARREYFQLLATSAENGVPVFKAEQDSFRLTHTEVAGRLLRAWRFPDAIVAAVAYHHAPLRSKDHAPLAALTYLGNILAYRIGEGSGYPPYAGDPDPAVLELFHIEKFHLRGFEERVSVLFRREQEHFCKE